jgi:hypothetical protein
VMRCSDVAPNGGLVRIAVGECRRQDQLAPL